MDRRKEKRKSTLIPASACGYKANFDVKCVIRDVSRSGCRLVSTEIGDLPEIIHVMPEGFKNPLLGKIEWRNKKMAGVRFIDEAERRELERLKQEKKSQSLFDRIQTMGWKGIYQGSPAEWMQQARRSSMEFVSGLVHELRTPLTSLIGLLQLLTQGKLGELPARVKAAISVAFRNADRLSALVTDFLDVNKIESGKLKFTFATKDIVALTRETLIANKTYGDKYGVKFDFKQDVGEAFVKIDAGRIDQVLTNLISNAAKFSPPGEEVVVSVRRVKQHIRVSVSDKGPGIPTEMQEKIFEKFQQAETSGARTKEGTGLGLSIAKAIMEAHGGTIQLKSKPGEGTTFWFDLDETANPKKEEKNPQSAAA